MAEVLVATAVAGILLSGAVWMFGQSVDVSTIATLRGDMQQNARVAINLIYRDLLVAGTGLPNGGVQLPYPLSGNIYPQLGCDTSLTCWVIPGGGAQNTGSALNYYQTVNGTSNSWLYWINPQDGQGASVAQPNTPTGSSVDRDPWNTSTTSLVPTDVVTIVYKDNNYPSSWNGSTASSLDQSPVTIDMSGTPVKVTFASSTNPAPNDSAYGLNVGDVLFFNNSNGSAVGTVTNVESGGLVVELNSSGDPLNFNQPMGSVGAASTGAGGVTTIQNFDGSSPPNGLGTFPTTTAFRVIVVTYFIDNYTYSYPRLMRQVNGLPPTPVAQNIENLQFSYDIYDSSAGIICPNVANPFSPPASCTTTTQYTPNQISKVNIFVQARSASQRLVNRGYSRVSMISAVSPRNLVFVDRY